MSATDNLGPVGSVGHAAPPVDVAVVVIGRNEGQRLVDCLASVRAADWGDCVFELIYVDSNSTDASCDHARQAGARVIEVKPLRPTAAVGRNAGWRATSAAQVLFLDGDTLLVPDFVRAARAALAENAQRAVVWGHRRERRTEASVYNRVLDLDWVYPPGETEFCGGDALFVRSALVQVGGFNETLIAGEEPELCARLRQGGWRIQHIDAPMTYHDLAMTRWRQYWLRAERAGHAYAEVSHRLAGTSTPLWQHEKRRNRLHSLVLLLYFSLALVGLATQQWLAVSLVLAAGAAVVVRSAWRARWKSGNPGTLLLYALHSHVQQLPIAWGQVRWLWSRRKGQARELIDYK